VAAGDGWGFRGFDGPDVVEVQDVTVVEDNTFVDNSDDVYVQQDTVSPIELCSRSSANSMLTRQQFVEQDDVYVQDDGW
jgi:hypothetical protein